MKKLIAVVVALTAAAVVASPIHVWVNGETLTHTDLNAALAHIHNLMVGGHGPRLVNADVSASAAISHAKLATPALVPKIWGTVASCASNPCTVSETSGVTSVGWTSAGLMTVNFTARSNATFGAVVTPRGAIDRGCTVTAQTTTTITVQCFTASTGAAVDSGFSLIVMDAE